MSLSGINTKNTLKNIDKNTKDIALNGGGPNLFNIARRLVDLHDIRHVAGFNTSVGTSFEDIWSVGGDITFLTTATIVELISLDANDTVDGLGARSVRIRGLSATGELQAENINLNGTTAVQSANTYIRINRVTVRSVGTYGGSNFDDITCQVTGGGAILGVIGGTETTGTAGYGYGETTLGMFSLPLGQRGFLTNLRVRTDSSKTVEIYLYQRRNLLDTTPSVNPRVIMWSNQTLIGSDDVRFDSYITFPTNSDNWFRARTTSGSTSIVEIEFDLLTIDGD